MNSKSMEPYGAALQAYFEGDGGAQMIIRREDGLEAPLPAGHYFREAAAFSLIEKKAQDFCTGRVLDVGAGTGLHSLVLQEKGLPVTAIDICPQAIAVMSRRGVRDILQADIFDYSGGPFDTVLMMGHGIGIAETLAGLDRFLARARGWLAGAGQVLLDSLDVRVTDDPRHLAYHEANRRAGRYIGEVRMQIEFRGLAGPFCGWLQVDPETLQEHAARAGWTCEVLCKQDSGDYLARLS